MLLLRLPPHEHYKSTGSALIYILIAVALLGALTASLTGTSGTQSNTQNAQRLQIQLQSQITVIRNAILECTNLYPMADPTINVASTTDTGYHSPYPLIPDSTHFTGSTLGVAASTAVEHLRCPGNPGTDNNHTPLFGDISGKDIPVSPTNFLYWSYYNQAGTIIGEAVDGVYIKTASEKTDPYIAQALENLADKYADCEADYIVGDGSNGCTDGWQCFRVWLIRDSAC